MTGFIPHTNKNVQQSQKYTICQERLTSRNNTFSRTYVISVSACVCNIYVYVCVRMYVHAYVACIIIYFTHSLHFTVRENSLMGTFYSSVRPFGFQPEGSCCLLTVAI